jgi:two-component system, NarL family, sensor kinase
MISIRNILSLKVAILLGFLIFSPDKACSNNFKSLRSGSEIHHPGNKNYADSIVESIFSVLYIKPDSARTIALNLLNNLDKGQAELGVRLLNIVGVSHNFQGNYAKSIEYYYYALEKAVEINDSTRIGNIYNNLGLSNKATGNYKDAYDFFLKALEQYKALKQVRNTSSAYHNIGLLYLELNNYERSRENFQLALEGFIETHDSIAITNTINNLGAVLLKQNEYGLAIEFFNKGFVIAEKINYLAGLCVLHQGKAMVMHDQMDFEAAIDHYKKAMEIANQIQQTYQKANICLGLARVYMSTGQNTLALELAYEALALAEGMENKVMQYKAYEVLSYIHEQAGNLRKSLEYFRSYNSFKEELLNQTVVHQVYNLEVSNLNHANMLKELEIERQDLIIRNKTNTIYFIVIAFVLSVIGIYLLYINFRYRQVSKLQNTILILHEKRAKAALEAEIKERTRIGTELHDSLGQMLSATRLQLEVLQQRKHLTEERIKQLIDTSISSLSEAFVELRSISHNLAPSLLSEKGLAEALKSLADRINQSKKFQVNLEMFGMDEPMDDLIEHSLFRIIQELISNTIKHANATHINIQLIRNDAEITLMAEDNGCGFDLDDARINDKGGLHSIKSRVENLNCSLFIDSMIGRGTIVSIVVPLNKQKNESKAYQSVDG